MEKKNIIDKIVDTVLVILLFPHWVFSKLIKIIIDAIKKGIREIE